MNELLHKAKAVLSNLLSGEVFVLQDLFKGYEWNRVSRSDRLLLGTLFLNYIKTDDIGVRKDFVGLQRYKKGERE